MTVEPYLALLVWRTRRPVRMVWSRQESITASTKRHPFTMHYRTAATKDGRILAVDADIVGDAGAYPCLSARVLFAGAALSTGPYKVPVVRARSRAVFTHNVPTSAFRGFGAMQVVFAYESQMDALAAELGLDRETVRDLNHIEKGDLTAAGEPVTTAVAVRADPSGRRWTCWASPAARAGRTPWSGAASAAACSPTAARSGSATTPSAWVTLQADGTLADPQRRHRPRRRSGRQPVPDRLGDPRRPAGRHQRLHRRHRAEPTRGRHVRHPPALHVGQRDPARRAQAARPALTGGGQGARRPGGRHWSGSTGWCAPTSARWDSACPSWSVPPPRRGSTPRCCTPGEPGPAASTRRRARATRSRTTPSAPTPRRSRWTWRPERCGCSSTPPATTSAGRSTRSGSRARSSAAPRRASATP